MCTDGNSPDNVFRRGVDVQRLDVTSYCYSQGKLSIICIYVCL